MDTKKLRQKILDLAIRGKLVPQDPNDEPASVLLERIRAEKERLIAEGKIKRPKKSKATSVESHYRKLPKGWIVTRLRDIAWFGGGKTPSTENKAYWDNGTVNWITSKDMKEPVITDSKIKLSALGASQNRLYPKGTLLMVTRSGVLRRTLPLAVIGKESTVNQDIKAINTPFGEISEFLYWYFSALEIEILEKYQKDGTTVESIDFEKFQDIEIFLPPLSEQKRIIDQLKTLLHLIDVMSSDSVQIKTTIEKAKSKILELAMQGKLVPQDASDEPAADMLRRINPKAKIITDNPHLENIPQGWCKTDLKSIGKWQSGATPSKLNAMYYGKGYPWLNTGDLNDGLINSIPKEITALALKETSVKLNPIGSVLIAMYGATIGKLGILGIESTTNQACCACTNCFIYNKFLFYFLLFYRPRFIQLGGGGAQPNISKEKIETTFILLPPLNEQKRIVAKLEGFYSVLDEIGASL